MNARRIFKYQLDVRELVATVAMPRGSRILSVHEQAGAICIWAIVTDQEPEMREFVVVPTGIPSPHDGTYIGTVHLMGGRLVYHVFAAPER